MKISDIRPAAAPAEVRPVADTSVGTPEDQPGEIRADHVVIGNVASAASKALDDRHARIAELRTQYLNGTYKVDAKKISSKLIDEHLG